MEPDYDNGESAYTEVIIDKGEEYGSKTLPENTAALVEAYLDAVQEYLAVSVDCWCAMNSNTIPALKTVDTSLDILRSQRTARPAEGHRGTRAPGRCRGWLCLPRVYLLGAAAELICPD